MASAYRDTHSLNAALADMAEELRVAILSMRDDVERFDHVMKLVADSDMVFCVWPDEDRPEGVGIQIIKGSDVMPPLVGFETKPELRIAAIPCVGREVALAAREALGAPGTCEEVTQEAESAESVEPPASVAKRSRWPLRRWSNGSAG
jgi:hypothetical protein